MSERRAYNQGYEDGARKFIKLSYQRRLERQAIVGWVLLSIALSVGMVILALVPFPGLGTQ